jgi:eukaryotic-like serine/threonine-protein kinase
MSGIDSHDTLLDAAASISDGHEVHWEGVRRIADQAETAVLDELRVLDGIAQIHRDHWGSLEILEPIGNGAFGTVYRAFDRDLLRHVALKVTRASADSPGFDPERLVREAQRLARVKHPNVVAVLAAERKGNEVGVVMEWLKGQTLDAIVQAQGPLGAREVAVIGIDVCRALAAVHAAGLLHGDVKAHNVMREEGGRIVLMDFGASRDLSQTPAAGKDFAGTPLYIAPEVYAGAPRSTGSDVYSLGVLLYYLASGRYPVDGDTRTALDRQHAHISGRRHLRDVRADLPDMFIQVVQRALAENPVDRFASVGALEEALTGLLGRNVATPASSRRRLLQLVAASVAVIAIAAALLAWREPRSNQPTSTAAITTKPAEPVITSTGTVPYEVQAAVYRVGRNGQTRVTAGDSVKPGDRLFMELQSSVPTYVYVVNEDEQGHHYRLFPLNGFAQANPLPAGETHRLPGNRGDVEHYWQVTEPGLRDHFVIFVSPTPLTAFEQTFAELPQASEETPVFSVPIGTNALNTLRGIGGVASATTPRLDEPLHEQYRTPLPATSETTSGPWVRVFTVMSAP